MKQHRYRITIEHLALPDGTVLANPASLVLDVGNHDELAAIVSRAGQRGDLPPQDAAAFAIGLKLFSEVMLQHRDLPLFAGFAPHFKNFMQRLKPSSTTAGPARRVQP